MRPMMCFCVYWVWVKFYLLQPMQILNVVVCKIIFIFIVLHRGWICCSYWKFWKFPNFPIFKGDGTQPYTSISVNKKKDSKLPKNLIYVAVFNQSSFSTPVWTPLMLCQFVAFMYWFAAASAPLLSYLILSHQKYHIFIYHFVSVLICGLVNC